MDADTLGASPGKRDELVAHLIRGNAALAVPGSLAYEVGVNDEHPDWDFLVEIGEGADTWRASLGHPG